MALTEILADLSNCLLEVSSEVFAVDQQRLITEEVLQILVLRVQVSHGIISTVLSGIFSREAETI